MRCPACEKPLVAVEVEQVELDVCAACEGIWFDAQEMVLLFERAGRPGEVRALEGALGSAPPAPEAPRRRCPRCRAKMKAIRAGAPSEPVVIDVCSRADGLWFDRAELPRILAAKGVEGSAALGILKGFLGEFADPRPS